MVRATCGLWGVGVSNIIACIAHTHKPEPGPEVKKTLLIVVVCSQMATHAMLPAIPDGLIYNNFRG